MDRQFLRSQLCENIGMTIALAMYDFYVGRAKTHTVETVRRVVSERREFGQLLASKMDLPKPKIKSLAAATFTSFGHGKLTCSSCYS